MFKDLRDWWYYNVYGYNRDMRYICSTIEYLQDELKLEDGERLMRMFPRIIKEVKVQDEQVMYKIMFNGSKKDQVDYLLHSK